MARTGGFSRLSQVVSLGTSGSGSSVGVWRLRVEIVAARGAGASLPGKAAGSGNGALLKIPDDATVGDAAVSRMDYRVRHGNEPKEHEHETGNPL